VTYILQLEHGNWYCGITGNLNLRLAQHWSGQGSRWTKLHKPVALAHVALGDQERLLTLVLFAKYGHERVRGSHWTKVDMQAMPRPLAFLNTPVISPGPIQWPWDVPKQHKSNTNDSLNKAGPSFFSDSALGE